MNKKINIGIIGLGHWGKNYLRIFQEINIVNVKYICDISKKNKFAKRKNFIQNPDLIFNDKCIDAVIISTNAKTHFKLAKKALENKKHILVEKPITLKCIDAIILKKIADKNNVQILVGHTFLYNSSIKELQKIITNKVIGEIYYINCRRTHLGLIRNDVDAVWDLAPHDISILNFILKKSPTVSKYQPISHLKKRRADAAFIHLKYPKNIIANIHVSWLDSNKSRIVEIIGSKAKIVFDDLNFLEPIRIFKKGLSVEKNSQTNNFFYNLRDGDIISPKINIKEPLYEMCLDFINSIKKNKEPLSNFKVGYDCIKVLNSLKNLF